MNLLKTYSISGDITGGDVNVNKLVKEIQDDGGLITVIQGVNVAEDVLKIFGESLDDGPGLDALVLAHVIPTTISLEEAYGEFYWNQNSNGSMSLSSSNGWKLITRSSGVSITGAIKNFIRNFTAGSINNLEYDGENSKEFDIFLKSSINYQSGAGFVAAIGISINGADPLVQTGMSVYASDEPGTVHLKVTLNKGDKVEPRIIKFVGGNTSIISAFIHMGIKES